MNKYHRKKLIALLEDKIHSQKKKIQILEEKCSGLVMGAEKEKEESKHLYAASNHSAVNSRQKNSGLKGSTFPDAQKREVPVIRLYIDSLLEKIILRTRNSKFLIF